MNFNSNNYKGILTIIANGTTIKLQFHLQLRFEVNFILKLKIEKKYYRLWCDVLSYMIFILLKRSAQVFKNIVTIPMVHQYYVKTYQWTPVKIMSILLWLIVFFRIAPCHVILSCAASIWGKTLKNPRLTHCYLYNILYEYQEVKFVLFVGSGNPWSYST